MASRYPELPPGHAARDLPGLVERFWLDRAGAALTEEAVKDACHISPNTFRAFRNGRRALPPGVILDLIKTSRRLARTDAGPAEVELRDAYRAACRDLFPGRTEEWELLDAIRLPADEADHDRDRAALQRLTGLTRGRLAEAGTLLETGAAQMPPPRLAELYVPRRLLHNPAIRSEEDLRGRCDTGSITVVTGDPGTGKTSLLWSLSEALVHDQRTVVLLSADELGGADLAGLRGALRVTPGDGPAVLLLDTVDLLLRSGTVPDSLAELILLAREEGAALVMTSRELEAHALRAHSRGLPAEWAGLGEFTDEELPIAVERHARHFLAGADPGHITTSLMRAVTRGLPVAVVCRVPLTLRMLFELAQLEPHDRATAQPVDTELDVTDVFARYWRIRVTRDLRAAAPATTEADLSPAAESLAVVMLGAGTPRVDADQLDREADRLGPGAAEALAVLARRRVVLAAHRSPREFFHQSFFEYAAARAVLRMGAGTVDELARRTEEHADDLFLAAVTHQTLVFACRDRSDALLVDGAFTRLLDSGHGNVQQMAIAAYAQARHRGPGAESAGRRVLAGHSGLARRYLRYLPRTRHDDVGPALADLAVVWAHGTADLYDDVVHALHSLALVAPHVVLDLAQADREPAWPAWYLNLRLGEARRLRRNVLRLVETLAAADPRWAADRFQEIAALVTNEVGTQDALASVLEVAARAGLPPDRLATLLATVPAGIKRDASGIGPLASALAAIVAQLWRADDRDARELAAQVIADPRGHAAGLDWDVPEFLSRRAMLRALAELIHDLSPPAVEEVLDLLLACPHGELRIAIAEQVLCPLLEGGRRRALAGAPETAGTPATKITQDRCAAAGRSAFWLHALHRADLTLHDTVTIATGLTRGDADSAGWWLDARALATVLVPAALGGHPGAANALRTWSNRLTPAVGPGPAATRTVILNRMRHLVATHPELLDHLIRDARRETDGEYLAGAMTSLQAAAIAVPPALVQPAIDAATALTHSLIEKTRGYGYTILAALARRQAIASRTVLAGLRKERHPDVLAPVLNLFAAGHDHDPTTWSAAPAFSAAEKALTTAATYDGSGAAAAALRTLYCRSGPLDTRARRAATTNRVRELVLDPRTQAALHPLQPFLSRLSTVDPEAAGDVLVEASSTVHAMEVGGTGSWKARRAHRWRSGIADVMTRQPYGAWKRTLSRLAEQDPTILIIAIDVSVRHRPEPVEHHIRAVLADTNQPEAVRAEFRHSLQRKQRQTGGSTTWPTLTPAWRSTIGPI